MVKNLLGVAAVAAGAVVAALVWQNLDELKRYLRIRRM
ncbi:DUF6893 family small protein [Kitasatospora sp. NPDC127111]